MPAAWIFDLDNTLFDTRSLPRSVTDPLFQSLRDANQGADAIPADALERAFDDSWTTPFPQVAETHGLPLRLLELWRHAHQRMTLAEPLAPYDDVYEVLPALTGFKCLLTSGYRRVQSAKIDALGLRPFFQRVLIDAADDPVRPGKQRIMAELMQEFGWTSADLQVVGDSATSELPAGRNLGIRTIQILRPGVVRSEIADRHVLSLRELLSDGLQSRVTGAEP